MHYTIYKITNKINGKYYIGKHQTKDLNDGYMGSGKLLKRAIAKYGIESFFKEILFVFDNETEMNNKEKELVVVSEQTYNLCPGGHGGFGYINKNKLWNTPQRLEAAKKNIKKASYVLKRMQLNDKDFKIRFKEKMKITNKKRMLDYGSHWIGKKHTKETKEKIGKANTIRQKGIKNSQYGTIWITDGNDSKKINNGENVPFGWYRGRILKG